MPANGLHHYTGFISLRRRSRAASLQRTYKRSVSFSSSKLSSNRPFRRHCNVQDGLALYIGPQDRLDYIFTLAASCFLTIFHRIYSAATSSSTCVRTIRVSLVIAEQFSTVIDSITEPSTTNFEFDCCVEIHLYTCLLTLLRNCGRYVQPCNSWSFGSSHQLHIVIITKGNKINLALLHAKSFWITFLTFSNILDQAPELFRHSPGGATGRWSSFAHLSRAAYVECSVAIVDYSETTILLTWRLLFIVDCVIHCVYQIYITQLLSICVGERET